MALDLRHLELLTAIAGEGTMTRAGQRLNLTQSALSHQLREAENRLGVPLFLRLPRQMQLTPAGERLLHSARVILEELRRAEQEVARDAAAGRGRLRLSTECYTCYHWLPARLQQFQRRFPAVDVDIIPEATRDPLKALREGRLDLAIVHSPARTPGILFHPLFRDEMLVIVSPGHALARRSHILPKDFAGENFIHFVPLKNNFWYQKVMVPSGVKPRKTTYVQLTEAIIEMVKAGLGVSVQARWAVLPHLESGELVGLPVGRGGFHREWCAATLRRPAPPAYVREFIRLLAEHPLPATQPVSKSV